MKNFCGLDSGTFYHWIKIGGWKRESWHQSTNRQKDGFSRANVSMVFKGRRRLNTWNAATKFAKATGTDPRIWLEGSLEEILEAVGEDVN